jgi:hypothetical protein
VELLLKNMLRRLGRSAQPAAEKVIEELKLFAGNPAAVARADAKLRQQRKTEEHAQIVERAAGMLEQCRQTVHNHPFYHDFLTLAYSFRPGAAPSRLRPITPNEVGTTAEELEYLLTGCAQEYVARFREAIQKDSSPRGYVKAAADWLFPQSSQGLWQKNICQLLDTTPEAAGSHRVEIATWTLNTAKRWISLSRTDEEFRLGCRFMDLLSSANLSLSQAGITSLEIMTGRAE